MQRPTAARRRRRRLPLSRFRTPEVKQLRADGTQQFRLHSAHASRLSPVRCRVYGRPLACETVRRSHPNFKKTFSTNSPITSSAVESSIVISGRASRRAYFLGLINHILSVAPLTWRISLDKSAIFVRRLLIGRVYEYFVTESMS